MTFKLVNSWVIKVSTCTLLVYKRTQKEQKAKKKNAARKKNNLCKGLTLYGDNGNLTPGPSLYSKLQQEKMLANSVSRDLRNSSQ